jgi:predicted SprT family Zn-dependent metalloprotease
MMTLIRTPTAAAQTLACELLAAHDLCDWSFRLNRSKVNLGLCRYGPKVIELSRYFVERNSLLAVRDTLLHEIAHAIAGRAAGHGPLWKAVCLRIGAKPERLDYAVVMPMGQWRATCSSCGMVHDKHRKPKHMRGWFCRRCGPRLGQLTWSYRGQGDCSSVRGCYDESS